jgi:hypothetical protein
VVGKYSVEPGTKNDEEAETDEKRGAIPGPGCHDDEAHKAQCLHGSGHVSLDIVAEARGSLLLQVRKFDQDPLDHDWRDEAIIMLAMIW